jgi:hypothetical protein
MSTAYFTFPGISLFPFVQNGFDLAFPLSFAAALSSLYRPVKVVPAPTTLPCRRRSTALAQR